MTNNRQSQGFGDRTPVIIQWGTLVSIIVLIVLGSRWTGRIEQAASQRWTTMDQQFFIEDLRYKNPQLEVCDVVDVLSKTDVKRN